MSRQPLNFYNKASTPRGAKQTTPRSTAGQRHSLRLHNANFEEGYRPGMYLLDRTADEDTEFNMDSPSPTSEDLGGDFNEYNGRGQLYTYSTPTQSHQPLGEYNDRETAYTTPTRPNRLPVNSGRTSCATTSVEDMVTLLQSQQGVLDELLKGQRALQEKTADLEKRFIELENKQTSVSLSSSGSEEKERGKRNRIVTSDLSAKVSTLYSGLETKYDTSERLMSPTNQQVLSKIVSEILQQPWCKYEEKVVKVAAQKCFENQRRLFVEQQSGKEAYTEEQAKKRKYRSRRERKFKRRTSVVKKNEMDKYWKHLSILYMTEESDDSDNPNGIVEHQIQWRSKRLDELIQVLDIRLEKATVPNPGLVAKKVRKVGHPSTSNPPPDAPVWAVHPEILRTTENADLGAGSQLDQSAILEAN